MLDVHSFAIQCCSKEDKAYAIKYFESFGCKNDCVKAETYIFAPYVFCRNDGGIDAAAISHPALRGKTIVQLDDVLVPAHLNIDPAALESLI